MSDKTHPGTGQEVSVSHVAGDNVRVGEGETEMPLDTVGVAEMLIDGERLGMGEMDGVAEILIDGVSEILGEGERDGLDVTLGDGVVEAETEVLTEGVGESDTDGEILVVGDAVTEVDALGVDVGGGLTHFLFLHLPFLQTNHLPQVCPILRGITHRFPRGVFRHLKRPHLCFRPHRAPSRPKRGILRPLRLLGFPRPRPPRPLGLTALPPCLPLLRGNLFPPRLNRPPGPPRRCFGRLFCARADA